MSQNSSSNKIIEAIYNGFTVYVEDTESLKKQSKFNFYGKGNLSRAAPQFLNCNKTEILRNRVYKQRKKWQIDGNDSKIRPKQVIVLKDSDDEAEENYFKDLKPEFALDYSNLRETVNFSLEEAFFLQSLDWITIRYEENNEIMSLDTIWKKFSQSDPHFVANFIVYTYFKNKNWTVKPAIKFGGDFLLYKVGPTHYHSTYVVIIEIVDEDLQRIESMSRRNMSKEALIGLYRLCETAGKSLVIAQIIWNKSLSLDSPDYRQLFRHKIRTISIQRWLSSKERIEH